MKIERQSNWLRCVRPHAQAPLRMVCFPHAGGGTASYAQWQRFLPADVEVWAVQLPGRELRLSEAPMAQLPVLIEALTADLIREPAPQLKPPYVLFGHSMGALLAFEFARQIRQHALPLPSSLIVSGCRAAQLPAEREIIHALPDDDFVQKVLSFEGTPAEMLMQPDLREIVLPALRADFTLSETYAYHEAAPLDCPILALGGVQDAKVSRTGLQAWQAQTQRDFKLQMMPGGHFFLHQHRERVLQVIQAELELRLIQHLSAVRLALSEKRVGAKHSANAA